MITDCRFPNELNVIKQHNGINIRVIRGPEPEWFQAALYANDRSELIKSDYCKNILIEDYKIHSSEFAWIGYPFDYTIFNDGSLEDFYSKIKDLFSEV